MSLKDLGIASSKRKLFDLNWDFAALKAAESSFSFFSIFFRTSSPELDFLKDSHSWKLTSKKGFILPKSTSTKLWHLISAILITAQCTLNLISSSKTLVHYSVKHYDDLSMKSRITSSFWRKFTHLDLMFILE